jgi:hypothetical protein
LGLTEKLYSMLTVSRRTLYVLAAIVWHVGGIVLLIKAATLLSEADSLKQDQQWLWIVVAVGLALGLFKARFLFSRFWHKNAARIEALDKPQVWQFFRPGFFLMLLVMILTGAMLSRLAAGHYRPLMGVATLDLSLAIALLGSGLIFWRQRLRLIYARASR